MLRSRSNCTVIDVVPSELDEVIEAMPDIFDSDRSSGVATELAIVSASAPGNDAEIWMAGKSTCGKGATGRSPKATMPPGRRPRIARNAPIRASTDRPESYL